MSDIIESGFPLREMNLCRQFKSCVAVKSITHSKCVALTDKHVNKHINFIKTTKSFNIAKQVPSNLDPQTEMDVIEKLAHMVMVRYVEIEKMAPHVDDILNIVLTHL